MYPVLLTQLEGALEALGGYGADSASLALHDPLYALLADLKAEEPKRLRLHGNALALALEKEHPQSPVCREVLAELAILGLWQPPAKDSPLEAVYRAVGVDPSDPEAGEHLQDWVDAQASHRALLENRLEAVRHRVRNTERYASIAVAIAILLGAALVVSLMAGGGIFESDEGLSSSEERLP
jgi:hypothetical protein